MQITTTATSKQAGQIKNLSALIYGLKSELSKVIVGQQKAIDALIVAVLCNGHVLLEGVPGVAKTTMVKALTDALGLDFKRIQFTPDLLPSDLIGSLIYDQKSQDFLTKKGPLFSNLILADEINRAPAKVQSALLEAMEEKQVTIGTNTYPLPRPFLVFATQNPVEQEGTYRLPEAQVDRFLFKVNIDYPSAQDEKEILRLSSGNTEKIIPVMQAEELLEAQQGIQNVYVDDKVVDYITTIVQATRYPKNHNLDELDQLIECGASPRATLGLYKASQAQAMVQGRHFVTPDDVKAIVHATLRHRITTTYQAEVSGMTAHDCITKIISKVPSP
ncbi:MoxR family ATPase [bacterium]|nr:MoxR family ATPase [bacterium]